MFATFVVLGLAGLAGGIAAIIDGWPYMLIERGFTQVIVGSVLSCTGLVMLAFAVVLRELRRLRDVRPGSDIAARQPAIAVAPPEMAVRPAGFDVPAAAAVAGGSAALAAAPLVFAATRAEAPGASSPESEPELPFEDTSPVGRGLLDGSSFEDRLDALSHDLVKPVSAFADPPQLQEDADAEPVATAGQVEPAPGLFGDEPVGSGDAPVAPAWPDDAWFADPAGVAVVGEAAQPEPAEARAPGDEFAYLRESLLTVDRRHPDEDWMGPAPRQDLTVQDLTVQDPTVHDLTEQDRRLPDDPWQDGGSASPEARAGSTVAATEDATLVPAPLAEGPLPGEPSAEQPDPAAPEPEVETPPAQPEPPAASDEGVVGAYQVGDAQFTLYVDGSIQARTPEGEFSFASMDELKIFLASEKGRIDM